MLIKCFCTEKLQQDWRPDPVESQGLRSTCSISLVYHREQMHRSVQIGRLRQTDTHRLIYEVSRDHHGTILKLWPNHAASPAGPSFIIPAVDTEDQGSCSPCFFCLLFGLLTALDWSASSCHLPKWMRGKKSCGQDCELPLRGWPSRLWSCQEPDSFDSFT